ncbi:hypothetical protein B0T25DRAFT_576454 [Lasiosphaeria hispida]|uniref:HNH nuclease domain-containing protein n=1 Tax=Lasiosphaeria hispida TaxID=260671 RepID=A0AAJ0HW83_9PEZI|nr:hypothetical protein B0T25DRAFT_576454 [Lasiosphaeria hispida]
MAAPGHRSSWLDSIDFSHAESLAANPQLRTQAINRFYHVVGHFEAAEPPRSRNDNSYNHPALVRLTYEYARTPESQDRLLLAFFQRLLLGMTDGDINLDDDLCSRLFAFAEDLLFSLFVPYDDGNILNPDDEWSFLDVAHILPHSLTKEKGGQMGDQKRAVIDMLNMFDVGVIYEIEGTKIDQPHNTLALTKDLPDNLSACPLKPKKDGGNLRHAPLEVVKATRAAGVKAQNTLLIGSKAKAAIAAAPASAPDLTRALTRYKTPLGSLFQEAKEQAKKRAKEAAKGWKAAWKAKAANKAATPPSPRTPSPCQRAIPGPLERKVDRAVEAKLMAARKLLELLVSKAKKEFHTNMEATTYEGA